MSPPTGIQKLNQGLWIAYQLKNSNALLLRNLITGKVQHFLSVVDYSFNNNGTALWMKTKEQQDSDSKYSLQWINLHGQKVYPIWSNLNSTDSASVREISFDSDGKQLVFSVEKRINNNAFNSIWYYTPGMNKAVVKANAQSVGINDGFCISSASPYFNKTGSYIFLSLIKAKDVSVPNVNSSQVDIWSYRDSILQSSQTASIRDMFYLGPKGNSEYTAVISTSGGNIVQIEQEDEQVATGLDYADLSGDFVVVTNKRSISEYWWKSYSQRCSYMVSLKDGSRKLLDSNASDQDQNNIYAFSPAGKYLLCFDPKRQDYFTYILSTGRRINISNLIRKPLGHEVYFGSTVPRYPEGIAGWIENDDAVLIYDNYDIWKVDPSARHSPINITNAYGERHGIKLRINNDASSKVFNNEETDILAGFDTANMHSGFYTAKLDRSENPELLSMGPYYFDRRSLISVGLNKKRMDRPTSIGKKMHLIIILR